MDGDGSPARRRRQPDGGVGVEPSAVQPQDRARARRPRCRRQCRCPRSAPARPPAAWCCSAADRAGGGAEACATARCAATARGRAPGPGRLPPAAHRAGDVPAPGGPRGHRPDPRRDPSGSAAASGRRARRQGRSATGCGDLVDAEPRAPWSAGRPAAGSDTTLRRPASGRRGGPRSTTLSSRALLRAARRARPPGRRPAVDREGRPARGEGAAEAGAQGLATAVRQKDVADAETDPDERERRAARGAQGRQAGAVRRRGGAPGVGQGRGAAGQGGHRA